MLSQDSPTPIVDLNLPDDLAAGILQAFIDAADSCKQTANR